MSEHSGAPDVQPGNPYAIVGVVLGLVGILAHSTAAVGLVLGVLALVVGGLGISAAVRLDRGLAGSITGVLLGVVALAATLLAGTK